MFPLSALSDVSSEWFPACFPFPRHLLTILTLLLVSHFSPFAALLLSPLGSHLCGSDCVLPFPLQSLPLSHQAKCKSHIPAILLSPGLASLHLATSPGFSPALHSLPHMSGPLNTFIISCLLLFCIVSWEPASFLPWSGTIELNMTCCLQLLVMLNT